ncbi:MAG: FkbM family methyltransferase [Nitrospinota bacterium]
MRSLKILLRDVTLGLFPFGARKANLVNLEKELRGKRASSEISKAARLITKTLAKRKDKLDALTMLVGKLIEVEEERNEIMRRYLVKINLDLKWRRAFNLKLDSVIRRLYLTEVDALPPSLRIIAQRFQVQSQNEEDGIILAIFGQAGIANRKFVEVGCGRTGGNAAFLALECGWCGLMVDSRREAVEEVRNRFSFNHGVIAVQKKVTSENINQILRENGFAGEVDLFSIDIDSHDYWVLEALNVCSPRLLVVEYNALFGPDRAVTIPRQEIPEGAPKGYHGGSLAAMDKVAGRKSYRLVACDNFGVNAFFLRNDVGPTVPGLSVREAYRPSLKGALPIGTRLRHRDIYKELEEKGLPLVEV